GASGAASRRDFLHDFSTGLAGIALTSLLLEDGALAAAADEAGGLTSLPHHPPRAKRVLQIFLSGGLSHVDSFDYKPELEQHRGQRMPADFELDVFSPDKIGVLTPSHFPFRRRGDSGQWISDLFPEIARLADKLTFIRSMVSSSGDHGPAAFEANSGFRTGGFPAMGAWISYGLGSENENLPTFVVFPDVRGLPGSGVSNWTNAFLPAQHQGTMFHAEGAAVRNLQSPEPLPPETRAARLRLLESLNRRDLERRGNDEAFAARIRSYELAARMQRSIPEAVDLSKETEATQRQYGLDRDVTRPFGRSCLMARRLVERGVRFVQLWSGGNIGQRQAWDAHEHVRTNHLHQAARIDRPVAGLLRDLEQRGLLDDTLVVFNTEFGRLPFSQAERGTHGDGRDHNQNGFTVWLAGAGLKPGFSYGETDQFGYAASVNPVAPPDFHGTILHLLGIDHERLTYYHSGIRRRLTDVSGSVIREIFA
ncbi:MAG: DUF1501 domain-containing protein, partial [Planctomycetales bacterium]